MTDWIHRVRLEFGSGKNVFLYIVIILCAVAAVTSLFAKDYVTSLMLSVMSLVLENILFERWSREDFQAKLFERATWDDYRKEFRGRLAGARKVSFLAVSPYAIILSFREELDRILSFPDGKLRFLVVDPDEHAMELIHSGRPDNKRDGELFRKEVASLFTAAEATVTPTSSIPSPNPLQIRLFCNKYNYVPSCILTLIDDKESGGVIFVTVYSYKQADPNRPSMKLTRADGAWYRFFQKEFDDLWSAGTALE